MMGKSLRKRKGQKIGKSLGGLRVLLALGKGEKKAGVIKKDGIVRKAGASENHREARGVRPGAGFKKRAKGKPIQFFQGEVGCGAKKTQGGAADTLAPRASETIKKRAPEIVAQRAQRAGPIMKDGRLEQGRGCPIQGREKTLKAGATIRARVKRARKSPSKGQRSIQQDFVGVGASA